MKNETFKGTMKQAYGKELDTPIDFEGSYEAFEAYEEIPQRELPSPKEVLAWRNNKLLAAARQTAMTAALDAAKIVKPTLETDVDMRVNVIKKALLAGGNHTEETALAAARAAAGVS